MNLIVGTPPGLIAILFLALAAAAVEDALRYKISNLTCGVIVAAALLAMVLHGFPWSLWQNALVFIVILGLGTPIFSAGWLGGGDVKLLAAIGLWLDLRSAPGFIAAVFIAGGFVALVYILGRRVLGIGGSVKLGKGRIAYGIAIAIGAMFIFAIQLHQSSNPFLDRLRAEQAARR